MASAATRQSIALTGDCLFTRPISMFNEDGFLGIRDRLRAADAAFIQFESGINRYLNQPHAQRGSIGSYLTSEPRILDELKWLGINLVSLAGTHADDYGVAGMLETIRRFEEAGMVWAGLGRHLAEARAPGFLDTPNGRIALLAAIGSFRPTSRAGEQRYDTAGYPGINGLRSKAVHQVDAQTLEQLRHIGKATGWDQSRLRAHNQGDRHGANSATSYNFMGHGFEVGPEFREVTSVNASDLEANLRQVRNARYFADRVLASLHCHEQGGPTLMTAQKRSDVEEMADFVIEYGRQCIDAGADIFVAHGPQLPLGIEIYKGKPLFHGIGTFIFQIETVKYLPHEAYERYGLDDGATPADFINARYKGDTAGHTSDPAQWEQMYAVCDFEGDELREIRIYPIELGFRRSRAQRGRPLPADRETGDRILKRLQRLSAGYGTKLDIVDGIGIVRPRG